MHKSEVHWVSMISTTTHTHHSVETVENPVLIKPKFWLNGKNCVEGKVLRKWSRLKSPIDINKSVIEP